MQTEKIGLGGGCNWCTEAIFQSIQGIRTVEQGFIASVHEAATFSEGIVIHFNPLEISIKDLIEIHLYTHNSTTDHSMRIKYRSAVYIFSKNQGKKVREIISTLQQDFDELLITKVYPFKAFKSSDEHFKDYYYRDPEKPFCRNYIHPKLQLILDKFPLKIHDDALNRLKTSL